MGKNEFVILVDELDNETGVMEKMEVHKKAILHRAISVFIINSKGEWLLQRRAFNKYHSNGLWTNTCCSHPFPGESNIEAAHRRLREEMGLNAGLEEIFQFIYHEELDNELTEHELDHIFVGVTDKKPEINTSEVAEWKYIDFSKLIDDIEKSPENYTVWFKKIVSRVNQHINSMV
jgi:isopentenyl-diphosphate delta-isomerase